ncbi:MAG TPA: ATP-binding protein, partial [Bacillota bacterium]|nr:ATP-binding protein [Bacillota bacterium]
EYKIFGDSHIDEIAEEYNLKVLSKLPIDPRLSAACDKGMIELFEGSWMEPVGKILENMEDKK